MEKIREFRGSYRFLSNFWPCVVHWEGKRYPSVEHAYQACKTTDPAEKETIRKASSPGKAKRLGKKVHLRPDWSEIKVRTMAYLVLAKFSQNSALKDLLLDTGNAILEEGNTWGDTFWGLDIRTGQGRNMLGKILMRVREKLRG